MQFVRASAKEIVPRKRHFMLTIIANITTCKTFILIQTPYIRNSICSFSRPSDWNARDDRGHGGRRRQQMQRSARRLSIFWGKGGGRTSRDNAGTNIAEHSNKRLVVITRDFVVGRLNKPYAASENCPSRSITFASSTARSRPTWRLSPSTTTSEGQVSGST